jgi:hypothetical protein
MAIGVGFLLVLRLAQQVSSVNLHSGARPIIAIMRF